MMVQPGYYKHHGGGTYTVLFTAEDSTNARELPGGAQPLVVVYVSHTRGHVCVRDIAEFTELVEWPVEQLLGVVASPHALTKEQRMKPRFMRWPEPEVDQSGIGGRLILKTGTGVR